MKYKFTALGFTLFLLFGLSAYSSAFAEINQFPEKKRFGDETLSRIGQGTAYYRKIIKVYNAALYGPSQISGNNLLATPSNKCLTINYLKPIRRDQFIRAANTVLERQLSADDYTRYLPKIEVLHNAYTDVKPGDQYDLCYTPRTGMTLSLNDKKMIEIQGHDFAQVYLGIWLGQQRPLSSKLRTALLGETKPTDTGY